MKPRLLLVDDDANIRDSLRERFEARGYTVRSAASGVEALAAAGDRPDIILLDLELPQGDGQSVLEELSRRGVDATVIVITAHGNVQRAVAAMKTGAYDFVEKPFDTKLLEETVRRALERSHLVRDVAALRTSTPERQLVGESATIRAVLATADKAAASNASVLILGESGTGKELLARQIHASSPRRDGPFVAINCAALSETLLESELFGHEKGAFTGANARKKGRLEIANGGTLFLDEIGDLPANFQVKLLRVLQERTFERVGGTEEIRVDVRVIAATHRDLRQRIEDGVFREDLYYRLNVIALTIPALRDRVDDIGALAEHFANQIARESGLSVPTIPDFVHDALRRHSWPGNVRELRNAIERALVLGDGEVLALEDLPADVQLGVASDTASGGEDEGFHARVERARRRILEEALEASDGNRTRAAERLALQRTYLARLLRKYGL